MTYSCLNNYIKINIHFSFQKIIFACFHAKELQDNNVPNFSTSGNIVVSLTCTEYYFSSFMIVIVLTVFLLIAYISLLVYYHLSWNDIPSFYPKVQSQLPTTFISVIVAARNEEKNLPILLNSLLNQDYPAHKFEVLVIDDFSTDDTSAIAGSFAMKNIKLLSLNDYSKHNINSYKKKAIETGINQSKGELIVTTDADCYVPPAWLKTISLFYEESKPRLIVMPVVMNCSNRFIEIFQSLDFMSLQGITGAAVHKNFHSMCNGANLAYTKQAFEAVNGFHGIDGIASGDDMLLMHKIKQAFPAGISYLKSKDVIVQTAPMHSLSDFMNQRIRWASKSDKYNDKKVLPVLLLVYLFNLVLIIIPIITIFYKDQYSFLKQDYSIFKYWLIAIGLKTLAELYFLFPVAHFFNKEKLLWLFPLAQPFHIFYIVIAGWLGKFGRYRWKDRRVK